MKMILSDPINNKMNEIEFKNTYQKGYKTINKKKYLIDNINELLNEIDNTNLKI